jgi:hypothetical protein
MRNLVAIALLIVSQVPAAATEPIVVSSMSTAALMDSCHRAADTLRIDCAGYIIGVFDEMSFSRLICPPNNSDGLTAQAVAVALKFLNEHPEKWHLPPVFLIEQSFKAAFPCDSNRD